MGDKKSLFKNASTAIGCSPVPSHGQVSVSEQGDCWIICKHRLVTCLLRSLLAFIWH
jgi:hypothetical protein